MSAARIHVLAVFVRKTMSYNKILNQPVPQTEPLNSSQVPNDGGGYAYAIDPFNQLDRFLTIGAATGTYYVNQRTHAKNSVELLGTCLKSDPHRTIERIVNVSVKGLAPQQTHAIFALAYACAHAPTVEARSKALGAVNSVCRTASTFFLFLDELRGQRHLTGRAVKRMISDWYQLKDVDSLGYQMVKYRNRNGFSHADAIKLGHVRPPADPMTSNLYKWALGLAKADDLELPRIVQGFDLAANADSEQELIKAIVDYKLPHEAIPTKFKTSAEVWRNMLPHMPLTALVRNLRNMSQYGVFDSKDALQLVADKLDNQELIHKSRLHPMTALIARVNYDFVGCNPAIKGLLEGLFFKAMPNVTPTNKRILVGLDVSGSMGTNVVGNLSSRTCATAMSLIWAKTELHCEVMAFSQGFTPLDFNQFTSLNEAILSIRGLPFSATDCSLPMRYAYEAGKEYDAFVILTDNETNYGAIHPSQMLKQYREKFVPDARQVILATSATKFSIADPNDPLAMDISGFSADVPITVANFIRGAGDPESVHDVE